MPVFALLLAVLADALAADAGPRVLSPIEQARHAALLRQLSPAQTVALARAYPDFRILVACPGSFSGTGRDDERVLGLWSPPVHQPVGGDDVHRVALIAHGPQWSVHDIDEEGRLDQPNLQAWQYAFLPSGFAGPIKCGIADEFSAASDLTYELGDRPFFDLKALNLSHNKPVCFATSDVYNNWDCFVYDPGAGRFRLWYQQAHAD